MTQRPYEKAFERLEKILEMMNSGKVPLEDSLKLYEEAEGLIRSCTTSLNTAEQKIEQLIKHGDRFVARLQYHSLTKFVYCMIWYNL